MQSVALGRLAQARVTREHARRRCPCGFSLGQLPPHLHVEARRQDEQKQARRRPEGTHGGHKTEEFSETESKTRTRDGRERTTLVLGIVQSALTSAKSLISCR